MPKSKRNKVVTLSKTQRKGRQQKESLLNEVRESFENYLEAYVFEFENMRNIKFKEFREELKDSSRFFLGGNKVLQVALGKNPEDEYRKQSHKLSELIVGSRGLFFTKLPKEQVVQKFGDFEEADFARVGTIATETVELSEGPLDQFSHDMEPFLRKQGLPVRLNKGTIELLADYTVCTEGEPISQEASRLLRLLEIRMATFKLHLLARWSPSEFEILDEEKAKGDGNLEADNIEEDD